MGFGDKIINGLNAVNKGLEWGLSLRESEDDKARTAFCI